MKSTDTPSPLASPPTGQAKTSFSSLLAEFHSLRGQIGGLFALAGVDPTKTREPARDLGISRGLAWRLTRIVRESDPTPAVTDLPGPASMAKFFDACRARAVPEEAIAKAVAAFERFESVLSSCTGDRKTLAMMMVNRSPVNAGNEASKARRQLFDGACGVWGVQAQTRFVSVFVFPSPDDPDMLNAGHVTGFVGFRRLSPKPWPLSYEALHTATGDAARLLKTPLDPEGVGEGQLQLLKRFCTPSLPDIRVVESGSYKRFELAAGPVGNEGLTTCVFGTHLRHIYPRYSETPDTAGFMVLLTTPVERVMFDMYVHRSMNMEAPPPAQLLDRLAFPHASPESDFARQSLPIAEAPTLLPAGIEGTLAPSIPWYTSLVEDVTSRLGIPITDFVGSRFEMSFPPIATTLSRRFDLWPKP